MAALFKGERTASDQAEEARRKKRGEPDRARVGFIGVVIAALVVIVALQMDKLPFLSNGSVYTALFDDAGGLATGDIVVVAGVNVGTVQGISLADTDNGTKAKVTFNMADTVRVGDASTAIIKTETVLGRRNLTLVPEGTGKLMPGDTVERTVAPYSLTDALEGATDTIEQTDTDQLNAALNTLSDTFSHTPDSVRSAVDGVARLSKAIADRDESLSQLLNRAGSVTDVVARRSGQINTLLVDANSLLGEVQARRVALGQLITGTEAVTAQISLFIDNNNAQLTPVLEQLNGVLAILQDNQENLAVTLDELGPYANVLGEAVSSGPYFSSLVGLTTFGDYTAIFMRVFQQKYPEAFEAFTKYAFKIPPTIIVRPDMEHSPDSNVPAPAPSYPSGPTG
ncbi:MCE family protein [Nocardia sp. 348MFTsu5.1]|uniref:MCE family protein n=1 Tax=Nocardia sp. 348MFTsu5.1 TaxID=1172185 RepID=UPI00036C9DFD|nr:MCE family protein [Nocardia sp. 348MFTsu5.1]